MEDRVFKFVVTIINKIRGGQNALLHRQLKQILEDIDSEHGDLLLFNHTDFLTGSTNHLNKFNLSLQGRNKLLSDMLGVANGFRNKLRIFKHSLEKNELTHFPSSKEILKEFKEQDKVVDFSDCSFEIQGVIEEFNSRFIEVEDLKKTIPSVLKLKSKNLMCKLNYVIFKPIPSFRPDRKRDLIFFKLLSEDRFHNFLNFRLKMMSMFGSTYICESIFSKIKSSLTDTSLRHLLRLSTTELDVDIQSLVDAAERPQSSH
ncbi:hypothetical protein PR048_020071 [Dryococelus australis]|uniref:HAT C-terminal dimerisation domain-containing protein n=1 Tax=Dryococelus australis TaxID=614101 RepID=A0ABQ9H5A3_9NEOP|nr:hypothetical protein PR048_020071 [Dryococelus australis]